MVSTFGYHSRFVALFGNFIINLWIVGILFIISNYCPSIGFYRCYYRENVIDKNIQLYCLLFSDKGQFIEAEFHRNIQKYEKHSDDN